LLRSRGQSLVHNGKGAVAGRFWQQARDRYRSRQRPWPEALP
jgi:hypothetical protein